MPIDFNALDTAVHGPIRLGVMTALQIDGPLDFTTLKKRLSVADGVLGLHLRKLEETGYVTCQKSFVGRRPKSTYQISTSGRKALKNYLETLQQLINMVSNKSVTTGSLK
jgi:predicted ArsR family transcriptional regulator